MRTSIRSLATALAATAMLLALTVAAASAHTQTVDPNGSGDGFVKPISRPWAMAHCEAQAPLVVGEASDGVVQFSPAQNFTNCVPGTRGD